MPRHHLIISGTGRAGTTFLVQLLTELGLDTGFADTTSAVFPNCHAGMEVDIRDPSAPYIVKSPFLCDYLDDVVAGGDVVIDHAILPVRDLFSAAQSRRHISDTSDPNQFGPGQVPGGLWYTQNPAEQETVLARQLYKILYGIAKHDIPMTLLYFPRFVHEPDYLYRKIAFALGGLSYPAFLEGFRAVSRPELVHDFTADSAPARTPTAGEEGPVESRPDRGRALGSSLPGPHFGEHRSASVSPPHLVEKTKGDGSGPPDVSHDATVEGRAPFLSRLVTRLRQRYGFAGTVSAD